MTNDLLRQERRGIQKQVNEDPTTYTASRLPMVDDGFGGEIENPFGTPTEVTIKGRIAKDKAGPFVLTTGSVGLANVRDRYFFCDHRQDVREGDTFANWRVGNVEELHNFGGVIGKQAILHEASEVAQGT